MTTKSTALPDIKTTSSLDGVSSDIGLLILRVVFGGLLAAHGAQKLFGWFSGYGLAATQASFEQMGYNPGKLFGTLAGLTELVGGLMLVAGVLTPLAAAIVLGTMFNAINATWGPGLFGQGGWEMPLLFGAVAATLAFTGSGKFSVDAGRPWERNGFVWGAGAVVLAVVTGIFTLILKWVL
ncbi:putative oxidoreductase [Nocardia amikacinitolerans]|uniref:Putative oxidoreductase n=1 Tax=Nocardia amikacinitolerans TaxID=756689 RepID=A0A285LAP2_9NOCA|nr:DoxX family protein [Nocardia amikacinitolerans]MCP2299970.1 putative oxidoreductase [Nocardia amikacinitolerans]MCP2320803.1 putative oxidoreductase [Nocardia amikacinitolerans]SNY81533.1 putative oxidoreductase [Nocardia amikacinitolerans]